jgi:hypothetical protein
MAVSLPLEGTSKRSIYHTSSSETRELVVALIGGNEFAVFPGHLQHDTDTFMVAAAEGII